MTWRAAPATLMVMTTKSLLLTQFGGSASADVDSPADEVFALLTDTSRLPEWNTRIRGVLETFWRRALFGRLRRHQMGDEVPASLRALGALAQDSVTAS